MWSDDAALDKAGDHTARLSIWFERCLQAINRVVRSYCQVVGGDVAAYPIAKESLDGRITCRLLNLGTGEWLAEQSFGLHYRDQLRPAGELTVDQCRAVTDYVTLTLVSEFEAQPHPFLLQRDLHHRALQLVLGGDYAAALVTLQSSAELLLRNTYRMILVDIGETSSIIDSAVSCRWDDLIFQRLPRQLGGNWSKRDSSVGAYWSSVYLVRNRIVHAGRVPLWTEARMAVDGYNRLEELLVERLLAQRVRYCRTVVALLDPPSDDHNISRRFAQKVEGLRQEPKPFWLPRDLAGRP